MSGDQITRGQIEGHGELFDQRDGRIARRPLKVTDIGPVDASAVGVIFLAPPALVTQAAKVGGKALADIHIRLKTPLSTIDLQTISDIPVDFFTPSSMTPVTDRRQRVGGKGEEMLEYKDLTGSRAKHHARGASNHVCRTGFMALVLATTGCAASPWGFPVPTMIGNEQGVAMTGVMKAKSEADVRRKLADKMHCPDRLRFASLTTERADNALGTKMLFYKAVMKCDAAGHTAAAQPQVTR